MAAQAPPVLKDAEIGEMYEVHLPGDPLTTQPWPYNNSRSINLNDKRHEDNYGFRDDNHRSPQDFPGSRKPIPVSTISRFMMPFSGLQFLTGLDHIDVQQTVELEDLLASVESENRYLIKSADSETLLVAAETSSAAHRLFLGSRRAFHMRLYDTSRQEALHFSRRLACQYGLLGCCYLQRMEVTAPPGRYLGSVEQEWTLLVPALRVQDAAGVVQFHVEGPRYWIAKEAAFKTLTWMSPTKPYLLGRPSYWYW